MNGIFLVLAFSTSLDWKHPSPENQEIINIYPLIGMTPAWDSLTMYSKCRNEIRINYYFREYKIGSVKIGDGYTINYRGISAASKFDLSGRKIEERYYEYDGEIIDNITSLDHYYFWEYYPNGQLKWKWEVKRVKNAKLVEIWKPWNILDYYYPNGKPYADFGNFKNGTGSYNVLDDQGKVCELCTENLKQKLKP